MFRDSWDKNKQSNIYVIDVSEGGGKCAALQKYLEK